MPKTPIVKVNTYEAVIKGLLKTEKAVDYQNKTAFRGGGFEKPDKSY